jgi:uncharacterized protein YbaP (TraB family)
MACSQRVARATRHWRRRAARASRRRCSRPGSTPHGWNGCGHGWWPHVARLGYQAELGLDAHLAQLVRSRKGRIVELETASLQAGMFSRLSDEQQWRLLEETLEMMASGRQSRELRELVAAYASADRAALEAIMQRVQDDPGMTAKFTREMLLDERNGPMADKLALLIARENNAVAAVGVLHLLGKRGLPELLRARGMTVERVY